MHSARIYEATIRHFLGPVQIALDDPTVSEVMVNGFDEVYVERAGRLHRTDLAFPDAAALLAAVRNIAEYAGRRIDADEPAMDARLPDGSRVHVLLPPAARRGLSLTIRKFLKAGLDLEGLVARRSLDAEMAEFLEVAVRLHKNILISGGTGTGKTSMLNALSAKIDPAERIIVIEDSSELQLRQPHTVYLESQPARPDARGGLTIRDLFVNALRMRPDRIVVGEVRRGEALDLIQSMISGHAGSLSTVHASTPRDAATRLETLSMMSDISLPVHVARAQVASAIDLVVQIARLGDGSRRVVSISEVTGLEEAGTYRVRDLYRFEAAGQDEDGRLRGRHSATGEIPSFASEPYSMGLGGLVRLSAGLFSPPARAA
jgi:pilus assembly protein CpaF